MRILVTGGCGFIGSNFINLIIENPEVITITNLDVMTYAAEQSNLSSKVHTSPKYRFVKGDINDKVLLEHLYKKDEYDTVVHFAAESHVDRSIDGADKFITTNINGTFTLVDTFNRLWGNKNNKLFIHVSTDEVFGSLNVSEPPFSVESSYKPNSPYAASKASSDLICRSYFKTHKFPVIVTNCSNNFGPNQHEEKLIPLVINRIKNNKSIPVYGTGMNVRDWIYVEDHCKTIWNVIQKGLIGQQYLIGGNNELSNIHIIKKICSIMGKGENLITFVEDRKGHDFRYAIDIHETEFLIGKINTMPFDEALIKTVFWYLQKP